MSGYDALDELYERLRGTEDARRAGGITPEAIRAARGGVVDEIGRMPATAAENAADGDSAPLADISRDTRERIEADLLALTKSWHDHDGDFMKVYSSVAYAQVKELLDRQAALTEREYMERSGISELRRKVDELRAELAIAEADNEYLRDELAELRSSRTVEDVLRAELDELNDKLMTALNNQKTLEDRLWEYDQTHMPLPVDADGVPIRPGDLIEFGSKGERLEVTHIGLTKHGDSTIAYRRPNGTLDCSCIGSECHHVKPRTVEDVLRELADAARHDRKHELDDGDIEGYAAEIRELMGGSE